MIKKLSILIPSLHKRTDVFCKLIKGLYEQKTDEVEIISLIDDGEMSIGAKRNELVKVASGEYISFVDDDDSVSKNYISNLLKGIEQGVDCCSLRGVITWDGERLELFEHSIKYDSYKTNVSGEAITYERFPNHLNCIKSSIVKQIKFPEINHGEDTDFATQIFNLGLIKTEYFIDEVIYHYQYKSNK